MGDLRKFSPNFKGLFAKEKKEIYERLKNNKKFLAYANWCSNIVVVTKDFGVMSFDPNNWLLSQWIIAEALFSDVETIFVVKTRQAGATTQFSNYDLFAAFTLKNMMGAVVGADYEQIRTPISILRDTYKRLPPELRLKLTTNNIYKMQFVNGNSIEFRYPTTRVMKRGKMGRGTAINFAHFTEVAFFANEEDLDAFEAALSSHYPDRKYIYETTANGYNFFYDRWVSSKDAPTAKCVFFGWWAVDHYVAKDPRVLEFYSKPLFDWEEEKIKEVKERYNIEILPEQMAWWRKQAKEKYRMDEDAVLKEFPFTEEDAFAATTKTFIRKDMVDEVRKEITPPKYRYHVSYRGTWENLEINPSAFGLLKVWEHWDELDKHALYVIGVDPAYSTRPDSDNSCIQVFKCYKDKAVQVAEYAYNMIDLKTLAYLVLILSVKYNAVINIEVQGSGQAVLYGIQDIKRYINSMATPPTDLMKDIKKASLKEYLYRRRDSLAGGMAKHTFTTGDLKKKMLNDLKDGITHGEIILRSRDLYEELNNLILKEGEFESSKSPDRVMATCLALLSWKDNSFESLPTFEESLKLKEEPKSENQEMLEQYNNYIMNRWLKDVAKTNRKL